MRSIILLLVCLFSICLKAQTEFRVYQKESKKSWYYISAPINGTKLNDILITTGDAGFYIKEHDFKELFPDHSFAKSKLKLRSITFPTLPKTLSILILLSKSWLLWI